MSTKILERWRGVSTNDEILKKELNQKDEKLSDSFTNNIKFGTSGMRGFMGAGTNKINEFTVAAAAEAYAKFLLKTNKKAKTMGVVIGHDNRHNSILFSEVTARVLMNNGIKAKLYEGNELQPTPLVSYTVRKLKLAGAVIITASHNSKEYNGFKVYDDLGAQLLPKDTEIIQEYMKDIDPLKVIKSKNSLEYIPANITDKYISETLNTIWMSKGTKSNIKAAFSPLHGTSAKIIPEVLNKMGVENYLVDKQMTPDADFSNLKSSKPEESKAYNKVISLARKKKADVAIITDLDADRFGTVVKYQKRYKYLNGNEIAALYLNYKLSKLKREGKLPKDGYIVKSIVSGNLAVRIAEKFGIKVYETHVGFKNIANLIETTKGTFLMGYEESYGMLLNADLARERDSIQGTIAVMEMVSYYKSKNTNLYSKLKDIYHKYGIHRTTQISKKLDGAMTNRLLKRISKLKSVNGHKIDYVDDYRKPKNGLPSANIVKVVLKNGSWFAVRPSETEPKVKIYIQSTGSAKQGLMDVVIFEKEISNFIDDNTETFEDKHWSWASFFKYIIFIGIIAGIMAFVFLKVYSQGSSGNIYTDSKTLIERTNRWVWISMFGFITITTFINGVIRKRLIDLGGQKVKIRHLVISGLMGSVISYVTPFAIGGDAIGYWYLRRKGFKRGPLLSSFISSTIIYQFGLIFQSIILIPIGLPLYREIFMNTSTQSSAALVLFIIGISWNIFATIMIFSLTIGRRFQEFIVRNSVKTLEWLPFIHIQDPGGVASSYQFEFREMRDGMKKIWTKKLLVFEVIMYEIGLMFFNSGAILLIIGSIVKENLFVGKYWTQIVAADMSNTANSLSITPGGSGTGEWLNININQFIYKPGTELGIGGDASHTASAVDFTWKIISTWPRLIISSLMILTIIMGENRRNKYKRVNKNNMLKGNETYSNTRFYKLVSIPWVLGVASYILIFVYAM